MKITKRKLRQIIKEERAKLNEIRVASTLDMQLTDEIVDLLIERRVIQLPQGGTYDDVLYQDALDYIRDTIVPVLKNLAGAGAWERK